MNRYRRILCLSLLFLCILTAGCGREKNTEIVLTTDFKEGEVFRIDRISCRLPEVMVYLVNMQNQYEQVYGSEIWQKDLGGTTFESRLKDTIIARIAQIKGMTLLADQMEVSLEKEEEQLVKKAADTYFSSLNEAETQKLGVGEEDIYGLYRDYALANKVYNEVTKDINPEISDDEARTISVKHILVKTYSMDDGSRREYTKSQKQDAYRRIVQIKDQLDQGADFQDMAERYNEDSNTSYAFGKGSMDPAFEEAAFNLDNGEISDIVTTEFGYHIILCTSTFDKEETDTNKQKILEKRKKEAFNEEYDKFVASLTSNLNRELWESISFVSDERVQTRSFFDVYNKVFE